MTILAMRELGVDVVQMKDGSYYISRGQRYRENQYVIEGDFS